MSDFVELTKILPLEQVAEIKAILDKGPPLPSQRLASLLTMVILTVDISKKKKGFHCQAKHLHKIQEIYR